MSFGSIAIQLVRPSDMVLFNVEALLVGHVMKLTFRWMLESGELLCPDTFSAVLLAIYVRLPRNEGVSNGFICVI